MMSTRLLKHSLALYTPYIGKRLKLVECIKTKIKLGSSILAVATPRATPRALGVDAVSHFDLQFQEVGNDLSSKNDTRFWAPLNLV